MGTHCSSLDDILEEDMHHWYTKFMRESPSGLITLFELKTMLEMNGMTEEASSYVDQVFFTFDMDGVRKHLQQTSRCVIPWCISYFRLKWFWKFLFGKLMDSFL